jgi:membrane protein YdbS with pleckstrin-like domain
MSEFEIRASQWSNSILFVLSAGVAGVAVGLMIVHGPSTSLAVGVGCVLTAAVYKFAYIASLRYRLNERSLESESGVLSRRLDNVDLFRVKDIKLEQTVLERVVGVGTITLYTADRTDPILRLQAVQNPRETYDGLKSLIERSQGRRVLVGSE